MYTNLFIFALCVVLCCYSYAFQQCRSVSSTKLRATRLRALSLDSVLSKFRSTSGTEKRGKIEGLKTNIRELSKGKSNGISATSEQKEQIVALARQLEKLSEERTPSKSKKLDGKWSLIFTTNEGSSAGKLGPFVGQVIQDIDLESKSYVNYVRLPLVEGGLTATWDVTGPNLWKVLFLSIDFKILGVSLVKKELAQEGIWRTTFVDDSMRILYAKGGKNTVTENIYILGK